MRKVSELLKHIQDKVQNQSVLVEMPTPRSLQLAIVRAERMEQFSREASAVLKEYQNYNQLMYVHEQDLYDRANVILDLVESDI